MGRVVGGLTFDVFDENAPEKELTNEEFERFVDEDVRRFESWFCSEVDQSSSKLSKPEIAIIKSYLWFKLRRGETNGEAAG